MKYHYAICTDGEPVMYVKRLFDFRGWRLDLHKMVRADPADCYHTHPYDAWRLVLVGGYMEELDEGPRYLLRSWRPFQFGKVTPDYCHRIHKLFDGGPSYSLWFHGPRTHDIEERGRGWGLHTSSVENV